MFRTRDQRSWWFHRACRQDRSTNNLKHAWEADRSLACGRVAGWCEHAEVDEPCAAVELGVDGLDEEWLAGAVLVLSLQDDDSSNLLWAHGRAPADDDSVAGVPQVQDREWDGSAHAS